jgi:hypothetical protein
MAHIALLGDSIFDNAPYTAGGPAVVDHLREAIAPCWTADLFAVDGSVALDVAGQLQKLNQAHTHLVLSVGGNDALGREYILDTPVQSSGQAFLLLAGATAQFESNYRSTVAACLAVGLPLVVCTIYDANFPTPDYQRVVKMALCAYNDVILRVAAEHDLRVIDLRRVCTGPADYANPIEPSVAGGKKIAAAILRAVQEGRFAGAGAHVAA